MANSKKKVLFLVNHDIVIYNFRKELVQELINSGYKVYISSPYGERIDFLKKMGCIYREVKINRHGKNPCAEWKLLRYYNTLLKEIQPDIILTFTIKPTIYGSIAARKNRIPCIVTITGLGMALERKGILQKGLLYAYRWCLKNVSCVFFQNKSNLEFFEKHNLYHGMKKLLPGSGVNLSEYTYEAYPDYPEENTKFLFVGRVMKDKGVDEYLEAAKRVKQIYPKVEFGMAGFIDGKYADILREACRQRTIRYYGVQTDIKPFYKAASAVVLPSYHEGMANVLLEAAAMGRPVIASNIPGCRETFDEGVSGLGFEVKSTEDLSAKLLQFIKIPLEIKTLMGKRGREKMTKDFDRNLVVKKYMNVIENLCI